MQDRHYFGTDGIRGLANTGALHPDVLLRIGHAVGRRLREQVSGGHRPRVLLVRDTRVSGPMIARVLTGGIASHGVDVFDGGVLPTPACALVTRLKGFDLGIVVSASHNPMPDNGLKFFGPNGRKLDDETELAIEAYIDQPGTRETEVTGADVGRCELYPEAEGIYLEEMVERCFGNLDLSKRKVVLDCSHGAGSRVGPRILAALGADVVSMNAEPTGLNINDQAGVFFAEQVGERVRAEGADFGFALDGDGDRVIMADETGRVLDGDDILGILSAELAGEGPGLVATVMSNLGLKVLLKERGISFHETPVGDRYVGERMATTGAPVGGEQSGHVIFREGEAWYGDGAYTALRVAALLEAKGLRLSELAGTMERFPQVLVNVKVGEKPPLQEILPLHEAQSRYESELGDEGRILLRYSGTESLARVMVEGRDADRIQAIAADLAGILETEIG